jgi:hypothetical protein
MLVLHDHFAARKSLPHQGSPPMQPSATPPNSEPALASTSKSSNINISIKTTTPYVFLFSTLFLDWFLQSYTPTALSRVFILGELCLA